MKDPKAALERFQSNPVFHMEEVQGIATLENYQKDIAQKVWDFERVSVAACHDVGKTWLAARIVLAFTSVYYGAKVITTAPTLNQVKRLLWSEIRAGHASSKYPLGGELLTTEWKLAPDWFAVGFTSRLSAEGGEGQGTASSFQGFHAPHILIVFDEATGIPKSIWDQVEGMLTSGHVRFLAIGNPTSKACEFYRTFSSPAVKKLRITCFDSPNLIANGIIDMPTLLAELSYLKSLNDEEREHRLASYVTVSKPLLSTRWVMGRALDWGVTHPLFVSKVLAEFPNEDDNALFHLGFVEEAQRRVAVKTGRISIGVDVARYGADKSVITFMDGDVTVSAKVLMQKGSHEVAGEVILMVNASPTAHSHGCVIAVDETGVGSGVLDNLLAYKNSNPVIWKNVRVIGVNFGGGFDKAPEHLKENLKKQYFNKKAQIFLLLSKAVKAVISLPDESVYLEELPTIIYKLNAKGQYVIESKDDYKARTGRGSPDHSDSLALANYAREGQNSFFHAADLDLGTKPTASAIGSASPW